MPRFYFNLASKDAHIPDDSGKELATLNDANEHARKLIHKILFHVGHADAEEWKVIILNNEHDDSLSHRRIQSMRFVLAQFQSTAESKGLPVG
jgi:hypothetical protein